MWRHGSVFLFALSFVCAGCSMPSVHSPASGQFVPSTSGRSEFGVRKYVKHVVVIVQENRSFENFFAGYPGADAPTYGCGEPQNDRKTAGSIVLPSTSTCPAGDKEIPLHQVTFKNEPNLSHQFESAIIDWDNGKMDGFSKWGVGANHGTAAYAYIERSQLAPYWEMAHQYVLADRMFPTEFGPSWTAHLTIVAGTDSLTDKLALADFADGRTNCNSPAGAKTTTVNINRVVAHEAGPYPCLDQFNTMAQLLDTEQISWKYYVGARLKGFIWSPFASIKYVYHGPDWNVNIIQPQTQIFSDITNGNLAAVSWVTPSKLDSDHPGAHSDTGPSWVTSVVNAIGESPYWDSTAIIILWDDWGGFFDDAAPPQLDYRGLGVRVPCLIVSAYARRGVVVHTQYEFGSILKFIREVFGLPPLGPTSAGYTDTRANSVSDSFDFAAPPRRFKSIPSKYPKTYFLHEPRSDELLDDD